MLGRELISIVDQLWWQWVILSAGDDPAWASGGPKSEASDSIEADCAQLI